MQDSALRQAEVRDLSFVPPKVMSQFVEVGNSDFAEKHGLPVICCLSQGIEKEGDPGHFVKLIRWPVQQGTALENA